MRKTECDPDLCFPASAWTLSTPCVIYREGWGRDLDFIQNLNLCKVVTFLNPKRTSWGSQSTC